MEMTCEGCSNAAKRVLGKIGGMNPAVVLTSFCNMHQLQSQSFVAAIIAMIVYLHVKL
jgi:copper chaperone CopZ